MSSFSTKMENFVGHLLSWVRKHDSKLFTRGEAFKKYPEPNMRVACVALQDGSNELLVQHTPMGQNQFPNITWVAPTSATGELVSPVMEYLVIVEDPDAPLPQPVVHGIYYGIPGSKTCITARDLQQISATKNELAGGFRYGANRARNVWSGPKPMLGHGVHRYMFQVIALRSRLEGQLRAFSNKARFEIAVRDRVVGWGMWVGTFERT